MTKPVTTANRVKASNKRRKDAGLIQGKVWFHPDDSDAVRAYAAKRPKTKQILTALKK